MSRLLLWTFIFSFYINNSNAMMQGQSLLWLGEQAERKQRHVDYECKQRQYQSIEMKRSNGAALEYKSLIDEDVEQKQDESEFVQIVQLLQIVSTIPAIQDLIKDYVVVINPAVYSAALRYVLPWNNKAPMSDHILSDNNQTVMLQNWLGIELEGAGFLGFLTMRSSLQLVDLAQGQTAVAIPGRFERLDQEFFDHSVIGSVIWLPMIATGGMDPCAWIIGGSGSCCLGAFLYYFCPRSKITAAAVDNLAQVLFVSTVQPKSPRPSRWCGFGPVINNLERRAFNGDIEKSIKVEGGVISAMDVSSDGVLLTAQNRVAKAWNEQLEEQGLVMRHNSEILCV